jgi:adenylylsulfate kinase-like enzyme
MKSLELEIVVRVNRRGIEQNIDPFDSCSSVYTRVMKTEALKEALDALPGEFVEIHVSTPIEVCQQRNPKGLYRKGDRGELPNFAGVDSPYEMPESPELRLDTTASDSDALADDVINYLLTARIIY